MYDVIRPLVERYGFAVREGRIVQFFCLLKFWREGLWILEEVIVQGESPAAVVYDGVAEHWLRSILHTLRQLVEILLVNVIWHIFDSTFGLL